MPEKIEQGFRIECEREHDVSVGVGYASPF